MHVSLNPLYPFVTSQNSKIKVLCYKKLVTQKVYLLCQIGVFYTNRCRIPSREYTLPVFYKISKSEINHMAQVEVLLNNYKIKVPKLKEGEFIDKDLQILYKNLLIKGNSSLESALNVGVAIEEKDIADLKEKVKNVTEDIQFVYKNLLNASENHKKAFSKF